jgi:hypothetical protein
MWRDVTGDGRGSPPEGDRVTFRGPAPSFMAAGGLDGVDREQPTDLANAAPEMCPCSRAIRGTVPAELPVTRSPELTKKGTHAMRALPPVLQGPLRCVKKGVSDEYSAHS